MSERATQKAAEMAVESKPHSLGEDNVRDSATAAPSVAPVVSSAASVPTSATEAAPAISSEFVAAPVAASTASAVTLSESAATSAASPSVFAPASAVTPAIRVRDLSFAYPGATAPVLRNLNWEVSTGAFALLVGGTGSGKSTLLSLLKPEISPAGLREGLAEIDGRDVRELAPEESARQIGYVFQDPDNQIACESVWHEMAFGLENLGTPQNEMRRLIAETSYFFGIEDWFRAQTDTLSGGRKQLLALASTLVMQPRLLLLDEPTAQLDPVAEKNFLHALFRVNRELGCTVVVATHRPRTMLEYATCAFELVDGKVRELTDLTALDVRPKLLELAEANESEEPAGEESFAEDRLAKGNSATVAQPANVQPSAAATLVGHATKSDASTAGNGTSETSHTNAARACGAWFRYSGSDAWVLRGLDIQVQTGQIHAIVGGNGCGKSTLLLALAGVFKLQRGSAVAQVSPCALVPQDPRALFVAETVREELEDAVASCAVRGDGSARAGLRAATKNKKARVFGGGSGNANAVDATPFAAAASATPAMSTTSSQVDAMLAYLGLTDCANQHPYDLSGGQRQLLALGKVLMRKPALLLLDEPTKGLDTRARRAVARVLRDRVAAGTAVLMATHDLDFVQQVADTVSMMFDGELASTEPAAEFFKTNVYYRP